LRSWQREGPLARYAEPVPIASDLLDDGEDVLLDVRPHWSFFVWPLLLTASALAFVILVVHQFPKAPVGVAWLLAAMVVCPAVWLAGRLARWFGTSLVVTDRRLVLRTGVLGRQVTNLRLQRVVDIHSAQRPLQRIIGNGRLILEVEGEEGAFVIEDVRHPRTLQRVLTRQLDEIDASQGAPRPGSATWRTPSQSNDRGYRPIDLTPPAGTPRLESPAYTSEMNSVTDQIVALDGLRRQGILSEQEFAAKKAELLRRI
jgi:membrane protein YdbS with pleckstrin-like domain